MLGGWYMGEGFIGGLQGDPLADLGNRRGAACLEGWGPRAHFDVC